MSENKAKGEMYGGIVCGKLYQLIVMHDSNGNYIGSKIMRAGGKEVKRVTRPLVAGERHTDEEIGRAVKRVYGDQNPDDEF